jgi:Flp pilus assembly pilin Flp
VNLLLNMIQLLVTRLRDREEGQTIVEYGLVIGGISLVLIAAFVVTGLGPAFADLVTRVGEALGYVAP